MENIFDFLSGIDDPNHREKMVEMFTWIRQKYPQLNEVIKWKQPMFTDHGTFIIGFSASKKHLAVSPESYTITHLEDDIVKAGLDYTKELVRFPWKSPIDYSLIEKMIDFNILSKANCSTFWRE